MRRYKVFSYVVAHDIGVAPNVDGQICTVCLCKPKSGETHWSETGSSASGPCQLASG